MSFNIASTNLGVNVYVGACLCTGMHVHACTCVRMSMWRIDATHLSVFETGPLTALCLAKQARLAG